MFFINQMETAWPCCYHVSIEKIEVMLFFAWKHFTNASAMIKYKITELNLTPHGGDSCYRAEKILSCLEDCIVQP